MGGSSCTQTERSFALPFVYFERSSMYRLANRPGCTPSFTTYPMRMASFTARGLATMLSPFRSVFRIPLQIV